MPHLAVSTITGIVTLDVILENSLVLPAHDIALEVGSFAADDHSFFIRVDDGSLGVRLIRRAGSASRPSTRCG
jgi:hypothetical protein